MTPDHKSNVRALATHQVLKLAQGARLNIGDFPYSVFMLVSGSIGVQAEIHTVYGIESKQVAVLNAPKSDLFGEEHALDILGQQVVLHYVALEATEVRVLPMDRLNAMLHQPVPERPEMTVAQMMLQAKAKQNLRLMGLVLHTFMREADAKAQAEHALRDVGRMVTDARTEERQLAEKRANEAHRAAYEDLLRQNLELQTAQDEVMERAMALCTELWKEVERLRKDVDKLHGVEAAYEKVCEDYKEATAAFHEWVHGQHKDSESFVKLLNEVLQGLGYPTVTHEDIFGVMSGNVRQRPAQEQRGLHELQAIMNLSQKAQGLTPLSLDEVAKVMAGELLASAPVFSDESPTDKIDVPQRTTMPPAAPREVLISTVEAVDIRGAVTRREGPAPASLPAPSAPIEGSGEIVVEDADLIVDDETPPTMAVPVTPQPPPLPVGANALPDLADDEDEVDSGRVTLVGVAPPVIAGVPENHLPPEMRPSYPGNGRSSNPPATKPSRPPSRS